MAKRDVFDEVKSIFEDLSTKVGGPVTNLYGPVESVAAPESKAQKQDWFILAAEVPAMPGLTEFVNAYTFERPGYEEAAAVAGTLEVRPNEEHVGKAVMCFAVAKLSGSQDLPVVVDAPGYEIGIYINKVKVAYGSDKLISSSRISAGQHTLAIIFFGGSGAISVSTDSSIALLKTEPVPSAPSWASKTIANYLDDKKGTLATRLRWHNDSFAGGWNVYKAAGVQLAIPTSVTDNLDGTVTLVWEDFDFNITEESFLFSTDFAVGDVISVEHDFEVTTTTTVIVRPSLEAPADTEDWEEIMYFKEGSYASVASVSYAGQNEITWDDTTVKLGHVYSYKLTALGFILLSNESDYSDVDWALAADRTPPGEITLIQVTTEKNVVRVIFQTPEDPDYFGARIYGPYTSLDPVGDKFTVEKIVKTELGEANRVDQVFFKVLYEEGDTPLDEPLHFYITPFDASDNERDPADAELIEFEDLDFLPAAHVSNVQAVILEDDPLELGVFPRIAVTWDVPVDSRYLKAEIQVSLDGGPFRELGEAEARFEYDGWWDVEHLFMVLSISKFEVKADPDTADPPESIEATITPDSADSEFVNRFTESDQYANNRPPNGVFYAMVDYDEDTVLEEHTLTDLGTITP